MELSASIWFIRGALAALGVLPLILFGYRFAGCGHLTIEERFCFECGLQAQAPKCDMPGLFGVT